MEWRTVFSALASKAFHLSDPLHPHYTSDPCSHQQTMTTSDACQSNHLEKCIYYFLCTYSITCSTYLIIWTTEKL